MARNALEAVFGALGSGLVGYGKDQQIRYGREQDALEREERRKRTELADALQAASMLESGRWGTEAQLQGRMGDAGKTAMQAALFAATAGKGPPSAAPMPTDVARAVPQLRQGMDAPRVSVGGQDLRLLETESDRNQFERAGRMEDAALGRQQDRVDAKEDSERKFQQDRALTRIRTSADADADLRSRRQRADAEFRQAVRIGKMVPGKNSWDAPVRTPLSSAEVDALRESIYPKYGITVEGGLLPSGVEGPVATPAPAPTIPEPTRPPLRPSTSRADRWEELKRAGFAADRATAIVREEMP